MEAHIANGDNCSVGVSERHVTCLPKNGCARRPIKVGSVNFETETNVVDVTIRRMQAKVDDPFLSKQIHMVVRKVEYILDPTRKA